MPEEYSDSNNASNDKIINKTEENEDLEDGKHSKIQKMLHTVQNFFNNVPTKWNSNKDEDKKNKPARQNSAVMSSSARNNPQNDLSRDKENKGIQMNVNDNNNDNNLPTKWTSNKPEDKKNKLAGQKNPVMSRSARNSPQNELSRDKENKGTPRNVNVNCRHPFCRTTRFKDEQIQQGVSDLFENLQLDDDKLNELKSKANDKNNKYRSIEVEAEALLEKEKRTESIRNKPEKSIAVKPRKVAGIKSRYSGSLQISSEEIHRRHSEPPIHRISSSANTKLRPSSDNISSKSKRLSEKNVGTAQMSRLRPESIIQLRDIDLNVKLTEYKPDVTTSFHQLSKFESNTELMSGGQFVFENHAHYFRTPDIWADVPIKYVFVSNDTHINEQSSLKTSSTETFVNERLFSGGTVTDNSSKGLIIPELFPLLPDILDDSPVEGHFSDGETAESFNSDSEGSVDFIYQTLTIREINNSNSDLDDFRNGHSDNDVPPTSTAGAQNLVGASHSVFRRMYQRNDIVPSTLEFRPRPTKRFI